MYLIEMAFGHCRSGGRIFSIHQVAALESLALSAFAQYFSGGQIYHCRGSYLSESGHVFIEPCTVIKAYTLDMESHKAQVFALTDEIAAALEQECVVVAIVHLDGALYWVKSEGETSLSKPALTCEAIAKAVRVVSLE